FSEKNRSTVSYTGFQACGERSTGFWATKSETALGEAGTDHRRKARWLRSLSIFGPASDNGLRSLQQRAVLCKDMTVTGLDRRQFLVEAPWLAEHLHDANIRIVDLRGYVKTMTIDATCGLQEAQYLGAREEYTQEHIPGAVYVDWTRDIVDPESDVEAQI